MKFADAVDLYLRDMWSQGRLTSRGSERAYRDTLYVLANEVDNRDPTKVGREDVKRTLRRWGHPNTQRKHRAIMVSFFDWQLEEGLRETNPARQTRRPKARPTEVYRLTRDEAARMLRAATGRRERRAIFLGICAGLRNSELRGLQGRHFRREGWVWVSGDIAKGHRERWVPVLGDLEPVAREIAHNTSDDEYVLPAQRKERPGAETVWIDRPPEGSSHQALYRLVRRVGRAAGISAPVHPHLLRHAFGDHIARHAGMRNAQFLLGHADVGTTETYVGKPTLDELAAAVVGFSFGYPLHEAPVSPVVARRGFEPLLLALRLTLPIPRLRVASVGLMEGRA